MYHNETKIFFWIALKFWQICNFNYRRKITHKIVKMSHVIVGVWKFNYDFKKVFTPLCLHKTNIASGKLRQYAYDAEYISCCVSNGWHLHTAYASSIYFLKFSSSKPSGTSSWFFVSQIFYAYFKNKSWFKVIFCFWFCTAISLRYNFTNIMVHKCFIKKKL